MRNGLVVLVGLTVVGLLAMPLSAQNLLLNADFEVIEGSTNPSYPNDPPNARIWLGDYIGMGIPNAGCVDPCDPLDGSWGSRNHWLAPVSPVQTWEKGIGALGAGTTQTYQTVAVSAGATVELSGFVHTGPSGDGTINNITLTLYDNNAPSGTVIETVTIDETLAYPDWYDITTHVDAPIGGVANSGFVTVAFTTTLDDAGAVAVVHVDDLGLTSSVACGTQHTVSGLDVTAASQAEDVQVTITGTDLELVTAVRLVNTTSNRVIEGTNLTPSPATAATSLTVDLPITAEFPGTYNVVTLQEDCVTQVLVDGFEILDANLLLNGGFSASADGTCPADGGTPNGRFWFGDYAIYFCEGGDCFAGGSCGARQWNATPASVDGDNSAWEWTTGAPETLDKSFQQTVPVALNENVTFRGFVHLGEDADPAIVNDATIEVFDGPDDQSPLIGSVTVTKDTIVPTLGSWEEVVISGQSTSGLVTVKGSAHLEGNWGHAAAVHLDAFSVLPDTACALDIALDDPATPNPNPNQGPHNADTNGVIITGTGLTNALVELTQVDTQTTLTGAVQSSSDTQITVDLPTNGNPVGFYNVLVRRENCVTPTTLADGFEIFCANPTVFSAVDPASLGVDEVSASETLTITGVNLDLLDTVSLTIGGDVFPGNIQAGGTDTEIQAAFDLSGAIVGSYNLTGTRVDLCEDPATLLAAFAVTKAGGEKLQNGTFDDFGPKGTNATPVENWTSAVGPDVKYNGDQHTTAPVAGDNHGSVDKGGSGTARVIQTASVDPGREVTLTGFIRGCASEGLDASHHIRILDGDQTGTEMDIFAQQGCFADWAPVSLTGTPTGSEVTVEWGFTPVDSGWTVVATHADELSLIQQSCNDPKADFDGDGDVDGEDFAVFQACYTGTNGGILSTPFDCSCLDMDGVEPLDIDQADLTLFEDCSSGPAIPADPACD